MSAVSSIGQFLEMCICSPSIRLNGVVVEIVRRVAIALTGMLSIEPQVFAFANKAFFSPAEVVLWVLPSEAVTDHVFETIPLTSEHISLPPLHCFLRFSGAIFGSILFLLFTKETHTGM